MKEKLIDLTWCIGGGIFLAAVCYLMFPPHCFDATVSAIIQSGLK